MFSCLFEWLFCWDTCFPKLQISDDFGKKTDKACIVLGVPNIVCNAGGGGELPLESNCSMQRTGGATFAIKDVSPMKQKVCLQYPVFVNKIFILYSIPPHTQKCAQGGLHVDREEL